MTWTKTTLSEVSDIQTGPFGSQLHASDYVNSGIPIIMPQDIVGNRVITDTIACIREEDAIRLAKYRVAPGDIIYSRRGDVERHALIGNAENMWLCGTGCLRVRPNKHKVIPQYLHYYLSSPDSRAWIRSHAHGTTMPNLNTTILGDTPICYPQIENQIKICGILELLDKKIDINNDLNDHLQEQAATVYGKYFPYTVTDDLPVGWRVGTVGEIVEIHDSKRIPLSGAQRAKMEKRIYPYYGAASLMDYVDEYIFDGKYLLLGEDGTVVDDAGYPILQYVWGQFWVNNHAHILTGKLGFNVESLLLLFRQTPVKSIVTGAVQPKISQANLRSIQVVVPPQPELDAFNELIRPLFDQIRQNQDQNKVLSSLRDALLPKLMSGELNVSSIPL